MQHDLDVLAQHQPQDGPQLGLCDELTMLSNTLAGWLLALLFKHLLWPAVSNEGKGFLQSAQG